MLELTGKYNTCKVFTDNVDNATLGQIQVLLNTEYMKDYDLRFMPDCHAGKGCTIGTVINIKDDKLPVGLIGNDLGCGILAAQIYTKNSTIDMSKLDKVIHEYIPSGRNIFDKGNIDFDFPFEDITANIDERKARHSIGTLGGGNHFIEVDRDSENNPWLVIHTGSRYLGQQVSDYWQKIAWERLKDKAAGGSLREQTKRLTEYYKSIGESKKLSKALSELKENYKKAKPDIPFELAYIDGKDDYDLYKKCYTDISLTSKYDWRNRQRILNVICV